MEAIDFFALDFPRDDWPAVDESVRFFYRLQAERQKPLWRVRPYEGGLWQTTTEPPTDEMRRWLEYEPITSPEDC